MTLRAAVGVTDPFYNDVPPYHPDTAYPELPFREVSSRPNPAYGLLRDLMLRLGLDRENAATPA